jgi:hypothetical protein
VKTTAERRRANHVFRVSLAYDAPGRVGKSASRTDTCHGHFATLIPDRQAVEVFEFEADRL